MLKDEQGNLLCNQEVASDIGKARINSEGVFTLEVSAAKPQIPVTGNDGKSRLVYSLPPSPEGERDEVRFVDVLSPPARTMLTAYLAVMLLLWGSVSESRAQEIVITAEFRPSLLNKGKDGFQNTTESTGICADEPKVKARCQNEKVFSIKLAGYAIQEEDIPAMGSERDGIYIKFPASPGQPLKIRLREDSKTMIEAKKPGEFTITKVGASYRERFFGHVPGALDRKWFSTWQGRTNLAVSKSPCPADGSIGLFEVGSYGADHFLWKIKEDGICYKQSEYRRPLNRETPSSSRTEKGAIRLEATKGTGSGIHCLDDNCSATMQNISFAYVLKLPDPLSMASGIYTNVDTLAFTVGNSSTDDIDFGDNFKWFGDQNVTLKFKLEVAHDLKVTPEFGAEKVILVPQDGSQRGWDRYLSGCSKPTKLTGRSQFRLSSSGEFTVYVKCDKDFSQQDGEYALISEKDPSNEVPVRAFLTLASNIVIKGGSQKSVTRQPLRTKKDLNHNIFHTNSPAQNYPGHIDFEVSGKKHIDTLLTNQPDTYKGNVTIVFDANIHT
ncbi:hypothetical protein [Candidatus Regiella endosymbiont of Tuberolachnus salignus]|uniref:hypothetical protein n=1 Tax=Candidatus Regiella endosymbiont of Tuberolachnus salignus TaxID=3077956 RepID=UPI0030CC878E